MGPELYEHPRLKKLLPPERRKRLAHFYARHGGRCVFVGRFLSMLRGAVFIMAAVQGMRLRHFLLWDGLALCLSAPVVVALGYAFSHSVDAVAKGAARAEHLLVLATTSALLAVGACAGCARGAWPSVRGDVRKPNTPKTENPRCPRGTPGVSQKESGSDLLSRAVSREVPSALEGLTSVFGMGTGGTPPT